LDIIYWRVFAHSMCELQLKIHANDKSVESLDDLQFMSCQIFITVSLTLNSNSIFIE